MRRRRFVTSAAVVVALAGCLGGDSRESDEAGEPSREVDWEPTATDTNRTGGDEGRGSNGGSDTSPEGADGATERGEGNATSDERDGGEGDGAFDDGATWEADEAQVAADARKAGAAVEFELETTPPESCGRTCRKLRAALTNTGTEDAHDVVVRTELKSGESVLRKRRDTVGDLESGETYRATERVALGTIEAIRVKRNGTLTVEHVVTSAERREVFRERIEP